MWHKRDWDAFFRIANKPSQRMRPPRPVHRISADRVAPAIGFSLAELNHAGISLDWAEQFGLPVDAGRVGSEELNISALRDFARAARTFHS